MSNFWRNNSLSVVMFSLFGLFLVGQIATGIQVYNEELAGHGREAVGLLAYLVSGHFGEALFENWESEFLQMAAYVFLTVFLFQKGSSESKGAGKYEAVDKDPVRDRTRRSPGPVKRGGWRLKLYQNSLGLAFAVVFVVALMLHGVEGAHAHCQEQSQHGQACDSMWEYMSGPQFWFESFQNWQSEFLAVGSLIVLTIFLRQQGSPESKPVAAAHDKTGSE